MHIHVNELTDGEFFKTGEFNGSDFSDGHGLARYRSAPSSFLAALLDSNASDNSSSGDDESDVLFSALIDDVGPRHNTPAKQEIGPAETEPRPGSGMETQFLDRQSNSTDVFFDGFGVMGEANHPITFSSIPSSRFMPVSENGRLKRSRDDNNIFLDFDGFKNQNGESRKRLVSHASLPNTSSEMAVVHNYLNFEQETSGVPFQLRAKRGFATHPRSIAERMRRNRISDKMKKLQDLFPNMDKQTRKSDMLDMAVKYIKDLQNQVQTLNDAKTKCVCANKLHQTFPAT